ncbi:MAG: fasciclin domain-containing protein [Nonlabens sp.]
MEMEAEKERMREESAVMVGGAKMYPDQTIVTNASNAKPLSTLVAAVKAGELVETLNGDGPFTVFAPTNDAFDALPDGTLDTVLKPENKEMLQDILTYHVVSGNVMAADLQKMIKDGNGTATFDTVAGKKLTAMVKDGKVMIKDGNGGVATVTAADVKQSNGVVHVIDKVLLPKK